MARSLLKLFLGETIYSLNMMVFAHSSGSFCGPIMREGLV